MFKKHTVATAAFAGGTAPVAVAQPVYTDTGIAIVVVATDTGTLTNIIDKTAVDSGHVAAFPAGASFSTSDCIRPVGLPYEMSHWGITPVTLCCCETGYTNGVWPPSILKAKTC